MKIAMFSDSYRPQVNGVVTSIDITKKNLEKRGHEVIIFAPAVPKYRDVDDTVYRFSSVSFLAYKEYRIGVPLEALRMKGFDFDIIHIHTPFSLGALAIGISRKYNVPCVGTFHTLFSEYIHYFIKPEFLGTIKEVKTLFDRFSWSYLPWFYNQMDAIISPSENIKNLLIEKGVKKDIFVVPTGIERGKISRKTKKECRKKFGFGDEKIMLHVGRITKEKNIPFIINSLRNVLLSTRTKLVITSDGPYKRELEKMAMKSGLQDRIVFTGYINEVDIADIYKAADIFVMASKTETQGMVLLEAAANGLPIIALDVPVISDFVRENGIGIVSSERNFPRAAEAMIKNRNSMYVKKCIECGRNYSSEKFVSNILKVYRSLS
jgi:glycosyltransferase involved in cell wall biosynthesis